jgi:hypothetical protein
MSDPLITRKCSKCSIVLELNYTNFQPIKDTNRFRSECRTCGRKMSCRYKSNNKAHVNEYTKKWKKENMVHVKQYNHDYFRENSIKIQARNRKNVKRYLKENPNFRYAHSIRRRTRKLIKRKGFRYVDLIGCSTEFFVAWINFQMQGTKYTFENYGTLWHLDHVIPCSSFDLSNDINQLLCFHWSNHQPLDRVENMAKNNNIDMNMICNQADKAKKFIENLTPSILDKVYTKCPIFVNEMIQLIKSQTTK